MPSPAERQGAFAAALLEAERPIPPGLSSRTGSSVEARFAIYRNNVAVGLVEALRDSFPVVERLVGAPFFSAMAWAYAALHPPSSPVMLAYGADFPTFIAAFQAACTLPYLSEVAELEWMWLEAYHAGDAEPLAAGSLERLPPAALADLRLAVHPSARWRAFAHPALGIWRSHQTDDDPDLSGLDYRAQQVLTVRPQTDVHVAELPDGAIVFLQKIATGERLADAASAALASAAALDLQGLLENLFEWGVFTASAATANEIANDER